MKAEEWRDIPGFSNYRISTYGRIASKYYKKVITLNRTDKWGYVIKHIFDDLGKRKTIKIHRIVITTFKGQPPSPKHVCRHYPDFDKTNNHIDNLHWATSKINVLDQIKDGNHANQFCKSLTEDQVIDIKNRMLAGEKYDQIQTIHKVSKHVLIAIRAGVTYSYFGPDISYIGRSPTGKLTDNEVKEIRNSNLTLAKEAEKRGLSNSYISKIRRGIVYQEVS